VCYLFNVLENQSWSVEQFKKCAYCLKVFESVDALAYHIEEKYTYCDYFCRYCFYRAYTPTHVLAHQVINILMYDFHHEYGLYLFELCIIVFICFYAE